MFVAQTLSGPVVIPYRTRRGLGDEQETLHDIQIGGSLAATGATAVVGSIAASGGTVLGLSAAAMVPIVGAAIAGITLAVIELAKGCGQTCIVASSYANDAEKLLIQNIQTYFAQTAPRTKAQQAVALANFDTVWQALQRACQTPALKDAGQRCITDRQAGACTWRQRADSPLLQYPGEPQPGACWNWWNGYRDPIANDATVDDSAVSSILPADLAASVQGLPGWVIPVALLGIAAVIL